jgi:type IV secretion system protein VirD4
MLERFRGGAENKLHGEARWARAREIRGAGLLGMAGIVLGKKQGRTLFFDGQGRGKNVLIAAPPGSGKTAGIMLPNCLSWPQSLVALDIKGECCALTAAYRESLGQKVVRLNFSARDGRTDQYNPFAYVSEDPDLRVGDIEKIARYLCPDPARGDAFWAMSAREMFRALALYLFDAGKPVTLGAIRDLLETEEGLRRFAKEVLRDRKAEGEKVITARVARDFAIMANRSDATHSGIVDQLMTALAPFANPLLRRATAENSFDLRDLRKDPVSIYLIVARPDLPALRPLLNLFVQQLVDLNTLVEFGKDPEHKSEVLLAMDEFAQVGRLDAIFEGITYFRSFGLRLLAIVQSPAQLKEIYSFEAAEAFEQSFDCRVYFTPAASDIGTAETVSRLLGTNTVSGRSRSIRLGSSRSSSSVTQSEKGRPLLLPQEVLRLPLEKEIVLIGGVAPILADKIRVWKESVFAQRMDAAP